ncbi:hypothetical protein A3K63_00010 [Candidatus Micrarchaeota archaeon RBG_16_49_10]|nr:MAG: hypothetical protein A3K63_00010 [Candidatus Micrarchaeota archaeon RBG_16_49_10]
MTVVSLFRTNPIPTKMELLLSLDGQEMNGFSFKIRKSNIDENELEIVIWYEEDIEVQIRKLFSDDAFEVVEYLRNRGQEKVIKRIYSFINLEKGTLEIYRGTDYVTEKVKKLIETFLKVELRQVYINPEKLLKIVQDNSLELRQATFKYVDDLYYHQLMGSNLQYNESYKKFLESNPASIRGISIYPNIRYLNGYKYTVNIDGDRGSIKIMNGTMKWRPRLEVRQIVDFVVGA